MMCTVHLKSLGRVTVGKLKLCPLVRASGSKVHYQTNTYTVCDPVGVTDREISGVRWL